jgi:pimeloyl-ACP methyl ester carboxylesterase
MEKKSMPAVFLPLLMGLWMLEGVTPVVDSHEGSIAWRPCHRCRGPLECATVWVPLDHDKPSGEQIGLALVRSPATKQEERIGSLFLNPGGPAASGVDTVINFHDQLFTPEVREHFDLVGFDPRGIARSTQLRCYVTVLGAIRDVGPFAFPVTPEEEVLKQTSDNKIAGTCDDRAGRIIDHMSTAEVARDLDMLRSLVGDEKLTYVGYSYGSFLGVTYVNLFPDKVRAVVVDGVIDPIAWTTGRGDEAETIPVTTRLRSDTGTQATLEEFFRLCDAAGPSECAFSGDSAARFAALAERLFDDPVEIILPDTLFPITFTYDTFISFTTGALYNSSEWPSFAEVLSDLEDKVDAAELVKLLGEVWEQTGFLARRWVLYRNQVEGFPGVLCSDSINPEDFAAWSYAAAEADVNSGYFGRSWTWQSSICSVWPGVNTDRYLGPFDAFTENPVLVVGTRYDPATPYEGAVIVADLLSNSSLLTVEGWGHTSQLLSVCADDVVTDYLLTGKTPPPGTTCTQDFLPFDDDLTAELALRQAVRGAVMSEAAFFPYR